MNIPEMSGFENFIVHAIKKSLQEKISEKFDILKKDLIIELEKERDKVITGTLLNITREFDIRRSDQNLIVTIIKQ